MVSSKPANLGERESVNNELQNMACRNRGSHDFDKSLFYKSLRFFCQLPAVEIKGVAVE